MQKIVLNKPDNWLKIMRIGLLQWILILLLAGFSYAGKIEAQPILNKNVSLNLNNVTLKSALEQIQEQTGTRFVYSSKISLKEKVNLNVQSQNLSIILTQLLTPYGIGYKVVNDNIVLVNKAEPVKEVPQKSIENNISSEVSHAITIRGNITAASDNTGMPGVSVVLKGSSTGTITDGNGDYELSVPD